MMQVFRLLRAHAGKELRVTRVFGRPQPGGGWQTLEPAACSRRLIKGPTRYSDFQRSLGIATNVLKARLDGFVEARIMWRHRYSEQPELYEYLLTDRGRALAPVLVVLAGWGDTWATAGISRSATPTRCAAPASPSTRCARTVVAWTTRPRSKPRSCRVPLPKACLRRLDLWHPSPTIGKSPPRRPSRSWPPGSRRCPPSPSWASQAKRP